MLQPQFEALGLECPDKELYFDAEAGRWVMSELDWEEFKEVLRGNGEANAERIRHRRQAHDEGEWVREAAAAYAAKQQSAAA